jgi:hypothetical protein
MAGDARADLNAESYPVVWSLASGSLGCAFAVRAFFAGAFFTAAVILRGVLDGAATFVAAPAVAFTGFLLVAAFLRAGATSAFRAGVAFALTFALDLAAGFAAVTRNSSSDRPADSAS